MPIKRDGKLIGYSVSATSSIALAAIQELYSNNDIDMSFRRFLSLDGELHHRMRDGSVMLVEKVGLAEKDRLNLNDNTLFKIIVNDLNIIGISCFFNITFLQIKTGLIHLYVNEASKPSILQIHFPAKIQMQYLQHFLHRSTISYSCHG